MIRYHNNPGSNVWQNQRIPEKKSMKWKKAPVKDGSGVYVINVPGGNSIENLCKLFVNVPRENNSITWKNGSHNFGTWRRRPNRFFKKSRPISILPDICKLFAKIFKTEFQTLYSKLARETSWLSKQVLSHESHLDNDPDSVKQMATGSHFLWSQLPKNKPLMQLTLQPWIMRFDNKWLRESNITLSKIYTQMVEGVCYNFFEDIPLDGVV